ncbi:MAG TPA: PAS domain-containing sensor histidine kinase [Kofleriaceae bacterium]|nr:PAS domain-containing sensor histidine kinase [Kofleriaceae bacterium]
MQLLIESVSDYAIFMLDPTGKIETWNRGAQLIKGYEPSEIIGKRIHTFYTPEDRDSGKPEALLAEARRNGRVEDEGWRVRKSGKRFWADVVITSHRDPTGELLGFVKVTRDLTERREAEFARVDLAHTQEALRLRDEFLSIASHELRTPLFALQLQLESLVTQAHNFEEKQRVKLSRALRNAQRLGDLIAALLDVARIAQGRLKLTTKKVDLAATVAEVIDRLDDSAHESKCTVVPVLQVGIEGHWDPLRIGQVVTNLLANAFKYAAGTRVDVELTRDGDEAVLRVMDRGPGIGEEYLEKVFDRFERAVSVRNFGGLGLGLYVTREIVVAHGGRVRACRREGGGAEVDVRLPIRDRPPSLPTERP